MAKKYIDAEVLKNNIHKCAWVHDTKCVEKFVNGLPAADVAPRWIPVTERLPEQYGNYFVSIDGDETDIGTIDPDAKNKEWSLCDANGFYWATEKGVKVTAWMPLPDPYKEGEEECLT